MKLNIAICDDDEAAIEYLKSCITHFYFAFDVEVSISTFTSGRAFLDSYTEKGQYQLIFMDVEMPELNGLDTASILRSTIDRYALLVFVSNYPEYMQKSFTVRAFYYLTKPYTTEDVEEVLKNAINEIEQSHTIYSIVSTTEGETTIYIQDLLYIEVENSDTQTLLFQSYKPHDLCARNAFILEGNACLPALLQMLSQYPSESEACTLF